MKSEKIKVYLSIPMTGRMPEDVTAQFAVVASYLNNLGYEAIVPQLAGANKPGIPIPADLYELNPEIYASCRNSIRQCDVLFADLTAGDAVSIGCVLEIGWAREWGKRVVVAASLVDLMAEKEQVRGLLDLARKVHDLGHESKFDKLREILTDPKYADEKFIVFTEHRDTLQFLVNRLGGMGFTGQIAQIHGGMDYVQREEEVERFRKPAAEGGARFLICTDAAGEGINLQFCWIMINYDVPWNPARLEQRMGRIHRYLQKHDPVVILNLVAPSTREGKVLKVLLDKLEKIRKVFLRESRSSSTWSLPSRRTQTLWPGSWMAVLQQSKLRLSPRAKNPSMASAAMSQKNCRAFASIWNGKSISAYSQAMFGNISSRLRRLWTLKSKETWNVYSRSVRRGWDRWTRCCLFLNSTRKKRESIFLFLDQQIRRMRFGSIRANLSLSVSVLS